VRLPTSLQLLVCLEALAGRHAVDARHEEVHQYQIDRGGRALALDVQRLEGRLRRLGGPDIHMSRSGEDGMEQQ
jgi:hypothetical protein